MHTPHTRTQCHTCGTLRAQVTYYKFQAQELKAAEMDGNRTEDEGAAGENSAAGDPHVMLSKEVVNTLKVRTGCFCSLGVTLGMRNAEPALELVASLASWRLSLLSLMDGLKCQRRLLQCNDTWQVCTGHVHCLWPMHASMACQMYCCYKRKAMAG